MVDDGLTELKNRGVADVLMLVCDGLKGLPDSVAQVGGGNERAAAVLARLGVERREVLARLHGTVVITGRGQWGADTCVPPEVLIAVERCGLETS